MKVPAFLLRRLYVKGSLRPTGDGFAFDLKNTLGSGYAEGALPLLLDETELPLAATSFAVEGAVTRFADVSPEQPMTLGMNRAVTVTVDGTRLAAGKHKLSIGFIVVGMGEMRFDVTDVIEEAADDDDAA